MFKLSVRSFHPLPLIRRAWAINPSLTVLAGTMAVTSLGGMVGLALDARLITGAPAWAKTVKFSLSILAYAGTMLWMLPYVTVRPRLLRFAASSIGAILLVEMGLIVLQAARGEAMHFNLSTPLNAALYNFMGASITLFWFINMGVAVALMAQSLPSRTLAWGLRLALLLSIIGMGEGYLMTMPRAQQMARMEAGEEVRYVGGHTVGAEDAETQGLPLLGWSTEHGDLRIGHFVGLHALQVIAFLGWWLGRRPEPWLGEGHRLGLLFTGAGGYTGLIALLTWQALRAQPLLRPDGLTLGALAALLSATGLTAAAIMEHARGAQAAPVTTIHPSPTRSAS